MILASLVKELNLNVACSENNLNREVTGGYIGDLLSDVMANSKNGNAWITCQTHQNIVAVASLKEHAGIILVLGKKPDSETINKASEEGIPILLTDFSGFEIAGKIYNMLKS